MAFERSRSVRYPAVKLSPLTELSNQHATLIANSLLLEVAQVRSAFEKFKAKADQRREADRQCGVCGSAEPGHEEHGAMLLCDRELDSGVRCNRGFHQRCLDPPLEDDDIPLGSFYCPDRACATLILVVKLAFKSAQPSPLRSKLEVFAVPKSVRPTVLRLFCCLQFPLSGRSGEWL